MTVKVQFTKKFGRYAPGQTIKCTKTDAKRLHVLGVAAVHNPSGEDYNSRMMQPAAPRRETKAQRRSRLAAEAKAKDTSET